MLFEELMRHPEKYKKAECSGTSFTYQVLFCGTAYIVSTSNTLSELKQMYCVFQDRKFFGLQRYMVPKMRAEVQAKRLQKLNGKHAPRILAYDDCKKYSEHYEGGKVSAGSVIRRQSRPVILREFVKGRNILDTPFKNWTLDAAVDSIKNIHAEGIIFDPHIKNLVEHRPTVYWVEVGRIKDERDPDYAKAENLLKFVYSTWTYTRSPELTVHAATAVKQHYREPEVIDHLRQMVTKLPDRLSMYFTTRMPVFNQRLQRDINLILTK
ncbi:MAG: hypothetical protein ABIF10_04930 [Candidatus Woesearchaeota archaeon]